MHRASVRRSQFHCGLAAILAAVAGLATPAVAQPVSTVVTYQGEIKDGGAPVATADVRFRLYDAPAGGTQFGAQLLLAGATLTPEGRFTVELDFGAMAFMGQQRWLEIDVRTPSGSGAFRTLLPRQAVRAAPHSIFATKAASAADADTLNGENGAFYRNASNINAGTLAAARVHGSIPRLGNGQEFTGANTFSNAGNIFAGDGNNLTNLDAGNLAEGTLNDLRLSPNVALLNRSPQTFAGENIFEDDAEFQGLVGIGTSPNAPLHVLDTFANPLVFLEGGSTSGAQFVLRSSAAGGQTFSLMSTANQAVEGGGKLSFRGPGGNNPLAVLQADGRLGIGTNTPGQMLAVRDGLVVDQGGTNVGTPPVSGQPWPGVTFGNNSSGEGIGSAKTGSVNNNGLDFYTNRVHRMSVTNAGNVGVGTANPAAKLVVRGGTTPQELQIKPGLVDNNPDGTYVTLDIPGAVHNLRISDNVSISDRLAIGTFSSSEALSVGGAVVVDVNGANSGTFANSLRFQQSGPLTFISSQRTGAGNTFGMDFATDNIKRMSIMQNGRIGVGTTSPGARLHVLHDGPDVLSVDGITSFGTAMFLRNQEVNFGAHFAFRTSGSAVPLPSGSMTIAPVAATIPNLLLTSSGNVGVGTLAAADRLHVGEGGNLRLGAATGTPNDAGDVIFASGGGVAKARIASGSAAAGILEFDAGGNGVDATLANNGWLGIGVTSPGQMLAVRDGLVVDQGSTNNGTGPQINPPYPGISFGGTSSGEGIGSKKTAGGNQHGLDFFTNRLNRVSITSTGLVGIGTTTPAGPLVVRGGVTPQELQVHPGTLDGANNAAWVTLDIPGNSNLRVWDTLSVSESVGIGTTTPSAKLEVATGDAEVRIRNTTDAGGGVLVNSFSALQLGLYNPTGAPWGAIPANTVRKFFGMNSSGVVGSLTNTSNSPAFRNILDDGSGRVLLRGASAIGGRTISVGTDFSNGNGAYLTDTGVWTNTSDRNKKENFKSLDPQWVLAQVAAMPVTEWNYIGDESRHIGPVAQDFYAAFGLGDSDKHIAALDTGGVALASIQALNQLVQDKDAALAAEREINARQQAMIEDLMKRLEALEAVHPR